MDVYSQFDPAESESDTITRNDNSNRNETPSLLKSILTQLLLMFMMFLLALNYIGVSYFISNGNTGFSFGLLRSLISLCFIPCFYIMDTNHHQDIILGIPTYKIFGSYISQRSLGPLLIVILSGCVRQMLIPISLMLTNVSNVGIIQPMTPVATTMIAIALKTEKLTFFNLLALVLCIIGLLVSENVFQNFKFDPGLILLLLIPIAKGSQIASLQLVTNLSPTEIQRLQIIGLSIIALPIFFLVEYFVTCQSDWGFFLKNVFDLKVFDYLAVIYSVVAVILISWRIQIFSVRIVGPITVSLYQCFQPIFVFILAYFLLNNPIEISKVIGTIVICSGLIVNQIGKSYSKTLALRCSNKQKYSPSSNRLLNHN